MNGPELQVLQDTERRNRDLLISKGVYLCLKLLHHQIPSVPTVEFIPDANSFYSGALVSVLVGILSRAPRTMEWFPALLQAAELIQVVQIHFTSSNAVLLDFSWILTHVVFYARVIMS